MYLYYISTIIDRVNVMQSFCGEGNRPGKQRPRPSPTSAVKLGRWTVHLETTRSSSILAFHHWAPLLVRCTPQLQESGPMPAAQRQPAVSMAISLDTDQTLPWGEASSSTERLLFPQHLQSMIQSASMVTVVFDNPKVPPLPRSSPLLREERGLPPYSEEQSNQHRRAGDVGTRKKKGDCRWESMPQPKRLTDTVAPYPTLSLLRQSNEYGGHGATAATIPAVAGGLPPTPSPNEGRQSLNSSNPTHSEGSSSPGLIIPQRRNSFDPTLVNKDGASILSQVLNALDLSDEEDEQVAEWITQAKNAPLPPPGRFARPASAALPSLENRPALALDPERCRSSETLSIPVRRDSFESTDLDLEDLEGLASDEDESSSEFVEYLDDDDDYELHDESETQEDSEHDILDQSFVSVDTNNPNQEKWKDDSTLATVVTTSTLSTLRSSLSGNQSPQC
jgi:hypothetical protein